MTTFSSERLYSVDVVRLPHIVLLRAAFFVGSFFLFHIIVVLQAQPEFGGGAKIDAQAKSSVGSYASFAF